jgi:hypothetical protein
MTDRRTEPPVRPGPGGLAAMARSPEVLAGLLFCLLGLGFGLEALSYRFGSPARMGSGFFPVVVALALFAMGAVIAIQGLRGGAGAGDRVQWGRLAPLLLILGAIGLFALLLGPLGYLGASFVTVIVTSFAGPPLSWGARLLQAAALAAVSAAVFIWGLGVPIPLWPGFLT